MRPSRVAALLRELADELELEVLPSAEPSPRRRPRTPEPVAPDPSVPVDEASRARARRILRGRGVA